MAKLTTGEFIKKAREVHCYNRRFDRKGLCFEFANGVREAVRLDRHLRKI